VVRRASSGEKLTLIDGAEKLLDKDILVIATPDKPVAVAGVMGGKDTEVGLGTRSLLLEAAVFNPAVVRASRRKLAIGSDSSYRFERGVDLGEVEHAAAQSAKLITELAKGKLVLSKSSPVSKVKVKSIALEGACVEKILGIDKIPAEKIKKILSNLGFTVKMQAKNKFKVTIPSYLPDVNQKEDLIEELARIFGYENIPNTLPAVIPQANPVSPRDLVCRVKDMLVGLGLNEVITHSLISRDGLSAQILRQGDPIEVLNPLSKEQEILRPGLALSLLKCVAHNLNQKQNHISIFEIAKGFCSASGQFKEELRLGICLCGTKPHFSPRA
jgi:phenylalanyl-tRNA synthetase beta chain